MSSPGAPSGPSVEDPIADGIPVSSARIDKLLAEIFPIKTPKVGTVRRIDPGQGYLSIILATELTWPAGVESGSVERPNSIIFKLPVTNKFEDAMDSMVGEGNIQMDSNKLVTQANNIEGEAYEWLLNDNWGNVPKVSMPHFYFGKKITETDREGVIVLEDLTPVSATSKGLIDGMTSEQVSGVFEQLARLHAHSIKTRAWLDKFDKNPFLDMMDDFQAMTKPMFEGLAKEWSHVFPYTLDDVAFMWEDKDLKLLFDPANVPEDTKVLCHGDLWLNNILCLDSGRGPVHALIDWQICHAGNCGEDMARFMSTGVTCQFRRDNEKAILERFYKRLTDLLGRTPPYSFDKLVENYERQLYLQLSMLGGMAGFFVGPHGPAGNETQERKESFLRNAAESTKDAIMLYKRWNPK